MLKTVSAISNAIGALNYKGTWNASTNSPALSSGSGTKGDYYVVSVAGSTTLDGISNWGIGDWAAFNGSVWQRVEGGADLNGVNLSVSGTSTLSGLTASTALALNASKEVLSVTNTGTGSNVLATSPTLVTPALGTPSALVGTNITGTAANFNINGTVGATTPAAGVFTNLTSAADNNIALSGLYNRTKGGTIVPLATPVTMFTVDLGNFSQKAVRIAAFARISSGLGGSRVFYRESLIKETGGASLSETNLVNNQGANGLVGFSFSGATISVTLLSSVGNEDFEICLEILSRNPGTITTI